MKGIIPKKNTLTSEQVIRAKTSENLSTLQLAQKFNVSMDTIRRRIKSSPRA